VKVIVEADRPFAIEPLFTRDPRQINDLQILMGMTIIRGIYAFQRGTAHEVQHFIGGRISRPVATEQPGWDFDCEALWRFGTFGPNNIEAWTV
jgi:hypothetical protein